MDIKVTRLPKSHLVADISVPAESVKKHFDEIVTEYSSKVNIAGFRPGHAPKSMVIAQIGENKIFNESAERAIRDSFKQLISQEKILPVAQPQVAINQFPTPGFTGELKFKVEVDITPQVKLGPYKELKIKPVKVADVSISDQEIAETLKYLQGQYATFKPVERGAKPGDRLEISFLGKVDGVEKDNLASQHHPIVLGNKTLMPEFEEKLSGAKAEEKKEFELDLPKTFRDKELAGKRAKFEVAIEKVEEVILPSVDNELAAKFGSGTIDDLKKKISENIKNEKSGHNQRIKESALAKALLEITQIDLPDSLVNSEVGRLRQELDEKLRRQNLTLSDYLKNLKVDEATFHKTLLAQATDNVKLGLTLAEVAKQEKIKLEKTGDLKKVVDRLLEIVKIEEAKG